MKTMGIRTAAFAALLSVGHLAAAQSSGGNSDTLSAEEAYLQESVEIRIIQEYRKGGTRQNKQDALDFAANYIARGNKGKEIVDEVSFIALEGLSNRTMEYGRIANDFPDMRAQAVQLLGEIGTDDARKKIVEVVRSEVEPNVVYESIYALMKTPYEARDVEFTRQVFDQFDARNPDSRMAIALLSLYEDYYTKPDCDLKPHIATIQKLSASPLYNTWVRTEALKLLEKIKKGGT